MQQTPLVSKKPSMANSNQESYLQPLQDAWKELYQITLPSAARAKLPSQPTWPVHNDHCFARIILDNVVGIERPWTAKIKSPAYKNMTWQQLESSIQLGKEILDGSADLVELDERSLALRGKKGKGKVERSHQPAAETIIGKRDREEEQEQGDTKATESRSRKRKTISPSRHQDRAKIKTSSTATTTDPPQPDNLLKGDLAPFVKKISLSQKTDFQKRVLTALCQIPPGRYTTYAAISRFLHSSPRAVGNAVRNNPFAPDVPCHRVLASGGGIGGFHGSWGRNGEEGLNDGKKRKLLGGEGVQFDERGKVVGGVWEGFT